MDQIAKPKRTEDASIQPSTVIQITVAFGLSALLLASLSRQETTKTEIEGRMTILEEQIQNLSDTITMMKLNQIKTERKPTQSRGGNVFAGGKRTKKKRNL